MKRYLCLPMIKLNQSSLDKLTELFTLAGYTLRSEKGNFKSGSCMIAEGKLIVLNKFSTVETRVTFLIEAIRKIEVDETLLDDRRKTFLREVLEFNLNPEGEQTTDLPAEEAANFTNEHEEVS